MMTIPTVRIPLTQGKIALVDAADAEWLSGFRWCAQKAPNTYYAKRHMRMVGGKVEQIYMHREILAAPRGVMVDHENGNGLDNRRGNIRLCSTGQNQHNRAANRGGMASRFKGVTWHNRLGKWIARVSAGGHRRHLGVFGDEIEAAKAYDDAARVLHGEFARLNFPERGSR